MSTFKVGQNVELRSGVKGLITKVLFDSPMGHLTQYQVQLEKGTRALIVSGDYNISKVIPTLAAPASAIPFPKWTAMSEAMSLIHLTLEGQGQQGKYAIHGSMAAFLHGAEFSEQPKDIDVMVVNMPVAFNCITHTGFFNEAVGGTLAVKKLIHKNGIEVEIMHQEDFGFNIGNRIIKHGVWIMDLAETLKSVILRHSLRKKEDEAFRSLVLLKGER